MRSGCIAWMGPLAGDLGLRHLRIQRVGGRQAVFFKDRVKRAYRGRISADNEVSVCEPKRECAGTIIAANCRQTVLAGRPAYALGAFAPFVNACRPNVRQCRLGGRLLRERMPPYDS